MTQRGATQALGECSVPEIDRAIQTRLSDKRFSAAACLASAGGVVFHRAVYGSATMPPPVRRVGFDALFDLASLTKIFGSGLAAYRLVSRGKLSLGTKLSVVLPQLKGHGFDAITVDMLLDHSAGFAPAPAFYQTLATSHAGDLGTHGADAAMRQCVAANPLIYPPGTQSIYSDLSMMVLGWVVEAVAGERLHTYLEREIFKPLGLQDDLLYAPLDDFASERRLKSRTFVATQCPFRGKILQGQVHDPNAYAMGGVAGHAGLFGTVDGVWRLSQHLLECYDGDSRFFHTGTLKRFWVRSKRVQGTTRALAWDTPSAQNPAAGKRFSRTSVGHLGFTGTSVWIDPSKRIVGVLLCNAAVQPDGREMLAEFRPRVYELIASAGEKVL